IIEGVISEIKPEGIKDMGRVIKGVIAKVASQADGKLVSDLVKQKLTNIPPDRMAGSEERKAC
ncbi:MAG: GatB/YqeY domain-containing protein, partial [Candidatus Omnitrophota bacterium]